MEKLDKEALAQQYANDSEESDLSRYDYKQGLEYAENHYLKLIEEKDKEIEKLNSKIDSLYEDMAGEDI